MCRGIWLVICLSLPATCWSTKNIPTLDGTNYVFALARAKIGLELSKNLIGSKNKYEQCASKFNHWFSCSGYLQTCVSAKNLDAIISLMGTTAYIISPGTQASTKSIGALAKKCVEFAQSGLEWSKFNPTDLNGPDKQLYQDIYLKKD